TIPAGVAFRTDVRVTNPNSVSVSVSAASYAFTPSTAAAGGLNNARPAQTPLQTSIAANNGVGTYRSNTADTITLMGVGTYTVTWTVQTSGGAVTCTDTISTDLAPINCTVNATPGGVGEALAVTVTLQNT